jgi:hypothetical protein
MRWRVRYFCAAFCVAAVAACGGGGSPGGAVLPPSSDSAPSDSAPSDSAPSDSAPSDSAPSDSAPSDSAPSDSAPSDSAVTKLMAEWSGHNYNYPHQGANEMHAALLDTGDPEALELWAVHLSLTDSARVARLVRGDIPRARGADTLSVQLATLDFSLRTVTPGTWRIGLTPDNFFGEPDSSSASSPTTFFWESAGAPQSPDAPAATELLQETTWDLLLDPVHATTPREFRVTLGHQGRIEARAGACSLRGRVQPLSISHWVKLDLALSGCGPGLDAGNLRGYGKLLMSTNDAAERSFLRFVGAVFTADGRTALSVSARPVLQPQ